MIWIGIFFRIHLMNMCSCGQFYDCLSISTRNYYLYLFVPEHPKTDYCFAALAIRVRGPIYGDNNSDTGWHYLIMVATQVCLTLESMHMEDISIYRDMYVNKRKGVDVIQSSQFA